MKRFHAPVHFDALLKILKDNSQPSDLLDDAEIVGMIPDFKRSVVEVHFVKPGESETARSEEFTAPAEDA